MLFEKIKLEPGETVLKVVRKHWFVIASELFGIVVMIFLPLFIFIGFGITESLIPGSLVATVHDFSPAIAFAFITWTLFSILTAFIIWTHYYLDLWVITDRRIILIDQISFFNRKVSSFRLERLQDIKATVSGVIATLLNFGSVQAQTAGAAESNFLTTGLPDPRGLQSIIQGAVDARLSHLNQLTKPGLE
jgi:Bacterial PH domain